MYLAKPLERWCTFLPTTFSLREAGATTLAASLATLPISAWDFSTLSITAIPANLVTSWAVAPTMAFAVLAALVSPWEIMAEFAGFPAWVTAEWIRWVAKIAALPSWASLSVPNWIGWVGVLIALMIGMQKKAPRTNENNRQKV